MTPDDKRRYDYRRKIMDVEWKTGLEPREAAIEVLMKNRIEALDEVEAHIGGSTFTDDPRIMDTVATCLAMIRHLKMS